MILADNIKYEHGQNFMFKIDELEPHPKYVRKFFCHDKLETLKNSILDVGQLHDISITAIDGKMVILAGVKRWEAMKAIGFDSIRALYVDRDIDAIPIIENFIREDLNAIERSESLQTLKDNGYSHEQIGKLIGKSVSTVSELLSLTRLPEDIKSECRQDNKFVYTRMLEVAKAPTERAMRAIFDDYKNELNGGIQKNMPMKKVKGLEKLLNQIDNTLSKIKKVDSDYLNDEDLKLLYKKIGEQMAVLAEEREKIEAIMTSVSRSTNAKENIPTNVVAEAQQPDSAHSAIIPAESNAEDPPIVEELSIVLSEQPCEFETCLAELITIDGAYYYSIAGPPGCALVVYKKNIQKGGYCIWLNNFNRKKQIIPKTATSM